MTKSLMIGNLSNRPLAPRVSGEEVRLSFTLKGAPRTKKNHGVIATNGGRPRMLPSPQFRAWNRIAQFQLAKIWAAVGPLELPLNIRVNVAAHIYRDRDTGDAVGYYQAIGDALEEGRILDNDRLIVSWDGSKLLKDAREPRVELLITEAHP